MRIIRKFSRKQRRILISMSVLNPVRLRGVKMRMNRAMSADAVDAVNMGRLSPAKTVRMGMAIYSLIVMTVVAVDNM